MLIRPSQLFGKLFSTFSSLFGCSHPIPPPPSPGPFLSVAVTHRFMDLHYTQIGYFIDQIVLACSYFGFLANDSIALNDTLNSQFNSRCSPPVTTPQGNQDLYSLCQDQSCPLSEPNPDCALYSFNPLINPSTNSVSTQLSSSLQLSSTSTAVTLISSTHSPTSSNNSHSPRKSSIGTGGIVGASIGGAIGLFTLIGGAIFLFRRSKARRKSQIVSPVAGLTTTTRQEMDNQHYSGMREMDSSQSKVPEMPG
jgi:hypothetical protein